MASFESHRQSTQRVEELQEQRRESNWRTVLAKGILLCEMEAEEDGIALFYQVRGESEEGDDLLALQLETFESQLKLTQNVEHIRRILMISMAIGEACLDPCTPEGCLNVSKVVLSGLRFLSMTSASDSWNSLYDDYLVRVADFMHAIEQEDVALLKEYLADLLKAEVDHFTLTIFIKMASLADWLVPHLAPIFSQPGQLTLIHPSSLLRKTVCGSRLISVSCLRSTTLSPSGLWKKLKCNFLVSWAVC